MLLCLKSSVNLLVGFGCNRLALNLSIESLDDILVALLIGVMLGYFTLTGIFEIGDSTILLFSW